MVGSPQVICVRRQVFHGIGVGMTMVIRRLWRVSALVVASVLVFGAARAQTLRIGISGPITTLDPHFYNISQNNMAAFHVFDTADPAVAAGPGRK